VNAVVIKDAITASDATQLVESGAAIMPKNLVAFFLLNHAAYLRNIISSLLWHRTARIAPGKRRTDKVRIDIQSIN